MKKKVEFSISSQNHDWSISRAALLLTALATMRDGLALGLTGENVFDDLTSAQPPEAIQSPLWQQFLDYVKLLGTAMQEDDEHEDPVALTIALGFLQTIRDTSPTLVEIRSGSLEGAIEAIADEIAKAMRSLFGFALQKVQFRREAKRLIMHSRCDADQKSQALGLLAVSERLVEASCEGMNAKITVKEVGGGSTPTGMSGPRNPMPTPGLNV